MVTKKDGSWHMCPDYRQLNKMTIKDKFHIHVIDELLDELQGVNFFIKFDLHSRISSNKNEARRHSQNIL
jgi:hypothetical protein